MAQWIIVPPKGTELALSQTKERIVDAVLASQSIFNRTQVALLNALGISQATLVRYISELKGEGIVIERPFGTSVIFEVAYDVAIARGYANKYLILDSTNLKHLNLGSKEWTVKVYNFRSVVYISARHKDGLSLGIPIYDNDLKELINAVSGGLNFVNLLSAIAKALEK